jgi:hypothetical protein
MLENEGFTAALLGGGGGAKLASLPSVRSRLREPITFLGLLDVRSSSWARSKVFPLNLAMLDIPTPALALGFEGLLFFDDGIFYVFMNCIFLLPIGLSSII